MKISGLFRKLGVIAALIEAMAFCGGCGRESYCSRTWIEHIHCVHNNSQAYVFVQTSTSVQPRNLSSMLRGAAGLYPERGSIQRIRDDVIVYQIQDGRAARFDLEQFGPGGGGYFLEGNLYFNAGAPTPGEWPVTFKWQGTNFVRLNRAEALALREKYTDEEELMKREGWGQFAALFHLSKRSFSFPIGNSKYVLHLEQDGSFYEARRSVSLSGLAGENEKLLLTVDQNLKEMSAAQYEKRISSK